LREGGLVVAQIEAQHRFLCTAASAQKDQDDYRPPYRTESFLHRLPTVMFNQKFEKLGAIGAIVLAKDRILFV
jgi:hypothetical protein